MDVDYGELNGHSVGTLMKEAVRRAIVAIRGQRFTFEATAKSIRADGGLDFVTTADRAAQAVFVELLREWFPTFGIVAEEDALAVPCTHPVHDLWFTVDPLDGTKAFIRRQSHGIGTMIALVCDGVVQGACVGDVMTQEVYATRPGAGTAHRISEFGFAERLVIDPDRPLTAQWLLLRDRIHRYSELVHALVDEDEGLFASVETSAGSIGIAMARLWKGEVGAVVLGPIPLATPWDIYPIVAICDRMGFVFRAINPDLTLSPWTPPIAKGGCPIPQEVLIVHQSRLAELEAWMARTLG
ncbi:MAG: hypothetical protein EP329_19245 [Deltaproteobacteria bacterium]|nr:MAG: hypothetical protein EP329_19245 [Deltaproteobacteria bacterium]